jgi:hypothetical protein
LNQFWEIVQKSIETGGLERSRELSMKKFKEKLKALKKFSSISNDHRNLDEIGYEKGN